MHRPRKKIIVLSGAGISAESGIKTFRDANGLWEGHDIMEVASPEGFKRNPELVLGFYNARRRQLKDVYPNKAHLVVKELETLYEVVVITQNVDDLHERAGSSTVIHLHGELLKARSSFDESFLTDWKEDITLHDKCPKNYQLRPAIVWFGEAVPLLDKAIEEIRTADYVIIVGTSLQVYPAAGLMHYADNARKIFYVDRNPAEVTLHNKNMVILKEKASVGMQRVKELLQQLAMT